MQNKENLIKNEGENLQNTVAWGFNDFLSEIEALETIPTNTTATGTITIQQTPRNQLRKKGLAAFKADLEKIYGERFDVVETKEGLVIVAENLNSDFTFSWEIKCTIKNLDYDPFIEANNYEEDQAIKAEKRAQKQREKEEHVKRLEAKRASKLAEIEAKRDLINQD